MSAANTAPIDWLEMVPPELATNYRYLNRCFFVASTEAGGLLGQRLLERQVLVSLIDDFAALHPDCEHAAVVSMWLQVYLEKLVPPAFAASYFLGLSVPVELEMIRGFFLGDGCLSHWCVPTRGSSAHGDPFERFGPLIRGHLVPVIDAVSTHTGITRRLLWSNAGACIAAGADALDEMELPEREAVEAADSLLLAPAWPDGWQNPLSGTVRFASRGSGRVTRRRRVCCLRYALPQYSLCDDCPKPPGPNR